MSRRGATADNGRVTDATAPALTIGPLALGSPVVLAPMAGVTNVAFRTLCREQERTKMGSVAGLYVCEMVTARALVEGNEKTLHMTTFAPDEDPRSLQLFTTDPEYTYRAARMIVDRDMADHIDLNFGCPVPKVTRRGGGAALPYKRRLFGNIVSAAVRATQDTDIPVTVKFRVGIDAERAQRLDGIDEHLAPSRPPLDARVAGVDDDDLVTAPEDPQVVVDAVGTVGLAVERVVEVRVRSGRRPRAVLDDDDLPGRGVVVRRCHAAPSFRVLR